MQQFSLRFPISISIIFGVLLINCSSGGGGTAALPSTGEVELAISSSPNADHTCVLLTSGQIKCWGRNDQGQLGLGDTNHRGDGANEMGDNLTAVDLGTGRTAKQVSVGNRHTCAILDNDSLKCWGGNGNGQLGQGDTTDRGDGASEMGDNLTAVNLGTGRTATAVRAGTNYTCVLLDNNTVKCWGRNNSGQLGLGDTNDRGDGANEMGDNLTAVNLGTGRTATALGAGENHNCVILDNNSMKCWGYNGNGQLGLGDPNDRGDGASEMGDNLPVIDLGTGRTAQTIAVGSQVTCAILDNSTTKCWGAGNAGQLGLEDANFYGDGGGEMGDNLAAVNLGTGRTAKAIRNGWMHTCALLDDDSMKCWGYNGEGELGRGDTTTRGDTAGDMGDNLAAISLGTGLTVVAIAAGSGHNCAILDNSSIKCWGYNSSGQLGQGDTTDRGDGTGEMGDNLSAADITL